LGVGLQRYPVKKKIDEKPPRNSAGFCGGGQGLTGLWSQGKKKICLNISPISFSVF
jgi:hypothetical protein